LSHPRLAALATSAWPAWLWSADGSRILWANAVGAASRFDVTGAFTAQIIRLSATLPSGAQERLERLRGLGAGFNRALTCACSRIVVGDGQSAVLIAATEPAGPALTLAERVRRLFVDRNEPIAVFVPEGTLIYANSAAQKELSAAAPSLASLGLETLAAKAFASGAASGTIHLGEDPLDIAAARLGQDATRVLMLTWTSRPAVVPRAEPAPPQARPVSPEIASEPPPPTLPVAAPIAAEPPAATPPVVMPTTATAAPIVVDGPIADRRYPLRFVWHMDADGRFGVGSDEFAELVGPRTMAVFGRLWSEIAADLNLDPDNQVARALTTRETWSGVVISWPVDGSSERLPVELSGLPVFDRDRNFRGYRGFGVCRDVDRINALTQARREGPIGFMPAPEQPPQPPEFPAPPSTSAPPVAATPAEPAEDTEPTLQPDRPAPAAVAPAAANVLPFRQAPPPEPKAPPTLSPVERRAFRELAQELTARLRAPEELPAPAASDAERLPAGEPVEPAEAASAPAAEARSEQVLLDRIPIGILIYRQDALLFANRHFLEWSGYENLAAIESAGGLGRLLVAPGANALSESDASSMPINSLSILTQRGETLPADGRMFTVPWNGVSALALILTNGHLHDQAVAAQRALGVFETENRELKSILDAATDGIVTLDAQGRIVSANARAASLFDRAAADFAGRDFGELFAPESERAARDYFERVARGSNLLGNALDVTGRDRQVPLAMTLSRVGDDKFSAIFRDVTIRRQTEEELRNAKRETQRAGSAKAEFLGKISHEIRTPLSAMTGFAEVIMAERFGPIGNERYREYVKDIHNAGTHLVSMLNDLLDLSKIETGRIELAFTNVNLNDLTQQCVGIMQPQANRARIIIRTSLTPSLPLVVADERSLRQIVLNLLTNSIKFTGPGGQVIVSTIFSDAQEAVLRVRDTGVGMSEKDIEAALEPFQQTAISGSFGSGGTGFGLSLTKALAEANRAHFSIKSAPNAGTLVEIAFPPHRIVAD